LILIDTDMMVFDEQLPIQVAPSIFTLELLAVLFT